MRRLILLVTLLALATGASAAGRIIIVNGDKPGVGFNDPTPATPVGGNNGTTLGQQRLNVFDEAARRWQLGLDVKVDVYVTATFAPIPGCTATRAILGQAAPMYWKKDTDFAEAPKANVWYPAALANNIAGRDLDARSEIFAQFNADLDNATCLGPEVGWYYGFDGQQGNNVDLFVVVLHELSHGLGFAGMGTEFNQNRPAVFDTHIFDAILGLRWDQMSAEQRRVSATNTTNLLWDGSSVRDNLKRYLSPATTFVVTPAGQNPANIEVTVASFGVPPQSRPTAAQMVIATDAVNEAGVSNTDACTALTNGEEVAGKIALIDRGNCEFATKALNAQNAGAVGVIIADNRAGCSPPGMGVGVDGHAVTIPVLSVTQNDGTTLKTHIISNRVDGSMQVDATRLAGTSNEGYLRLYAPCQLELGSSIYHWDIVATPNLLMEPDINADLSHGLDLTLNHLVDIGWTTRTGRPPGKR